MAIKFKRNIDLYKILKKKNFFLLGARSTGKSFWIKETIRSEVAYINLLQGSLLTRLDEQPELLEQVIDDKNAKICIIDEIQKLPKLLDEVHRLIEDREFRFILTGSSARKLKRTHANLLGGRAGIVHFLPLSYSEIPNFKLEKYLTIGGLPKIYNSESPFELLEDYINTYLEQEIRLEANLRNLGPYQRFLKTAALHSGEMIQFTNIASDSGVPISTVRDYFQILEDTLIGFILEPWIESKKRKAIQTAKFYLFDPGIQNALLDIHALDRNSDRWGKLFEGFILSELRAYISYQQKGRKLYYWRSTSKQEVDFIVGDTIAIEVKSTKKISEKHLAGLKALREENLIKSFLIISEDSLNRVNDEISILHWQTFLKRLWAGEIF
jgi:predicted AAA+ superfamily ATPase